MKVEEGTVIEEIISILLEIVQIGVTDTLEYDYGVGTSRYKEIPLRIKALHSLYRVAILRDNDNLVRVLLELASKDPLIFEDAFWLLKNISKRKGVSAGSLLTSISINDDRFKTIAAKIDELNLVKLQKKKTRKTNHN